MTVFKTQKVPLEKIGASSFLEPPWDEEFARRYGLICDGELPLYHAEIPHSLIRPFAPEFRPRNDPQGAQIIGRIASMIEEALSRHERTPSVWVYPGDVHYVMSDDYVVHEAYGSAGKDHVPCFVMGEPTIPGPVGVMGPVPREAVDRITGRG